MCASMSSAAIQTDGLTKRFGSTVAVDRLDLDIGPGQVFGFLGPNGAGKSTTIRLLLGFLRPTAGRARIFGIDAFEATQAHRQLAHVPAEVALWPTLTGAEALSLLAALGPGTDLAYRSELVERFELDPDRRCGTYSSGNRQKVALVAAFATRAPLLVLDEPTSGLDPLMEQQLRGCVREAVDRGQTVFLSSHHLAEVEAVCDQVGILRSGRLVEVTGLDELRRLRMTELTASFAGDAPRVSELEGLPGVTSVRAVSPSSLVVTFAESPAAVLAHLANLNLSDLRMREPTLKEVFLDYYGQGSA